MKTTRGTLARLKEANSFGFDMFVDVATPEDINNLLDDADELARLREGVRINAGHLSKEGLVEAADVFYELLNNGAKADAMIEREDSE